MHIYLPANPQGQWIRASREGEREFAELVAQFPCPRVACVYILGTFKAAPFDAILADYDSMQAQMQANGAIISSPLLLAD